MRTGKLDLDQFYPENTLQTVISTALLAGGALMADAAGAPAGGAFATGLLALGCGWLARQALTSWKRDNCLLGSDLEQWPYNKPKNAEQDGELTEIYREIFETDDISVKLEDASQYHIHVIHHRGLNINNKLVAIALRLGIESLPGKRGAEAIPVILFEVWRAGCSAILIKKHPDEWGGPVAFKPEHLTQGKPRAYIGDAINGQPIIIDHAIEHGALVAGTSGSGKTEVFVAHYKSMKLTGLNPEIHILDLKGTPQLRRLPADSYISTARNDDGDIAPDLQGAYELMHALTLRLAERMKNYTDANADNIWQYRKQHSDERPICLYIDELAVLSRSAKTAERDSPVSNIMDTLASLAQLGRSSGLILLAGMQHPIADDIPTPIRNQLMTRIVLAVADADAAKVAGVPGAQHQPMQGGMIVKHANRIQIGRGAYIPAG